MKEFLKKKSAGILARILPKAIWIRYIVLKEGIDLIHCEVKSKQ